MPRPDVTWARARKLNAAPARKISVAALLRSGSVSALAEWRSGERGSLYAMAGTASSTAANFFVVAIAAAKLTPTGQGFFFTFMSLLLFQTVLEVGFSTVLTQFVSHEWSRLAGDSHDSAGPGRVARVRLASLIRLSIRWYRYLALAVLAILGTGGFVFLSSRDAHGLDWVPAWFFLVAGSAGYLQLIPLSGLLEGCDRVAANRRGLLVGNLAGSLVSCVALLAGAGLYALPLATVARTAISAILLLGASRDLLSLRRHQEGNEGVDWRREFWPQQWRIGLSWIAGFAMFQSFTPIAFVVDGPVLAGKVGIAVQALLVVQWLGMAWVIASQPRMGAAASRRDMPALRKLAWETLERSVATALVAVVACVSVVVAAKIIDPQYGSRLGDLLSLGIFVTCAIFLQLSNVETTAVRFQKHEPFLVVSIVGAGLVIVSNFLLGQAFGARGMALGFAFVVLLVVLPWVHVLFQRHTRSGSEPLSRTHPKKG